MAIEKKISEVELLEQISSNTNVVCDQDGSWKRLNIFNTDFFKHSLNNNGIEVKGDGETPILVKIITDTSGHVIGCENVTKDDIVNLGIPDKDTVYTHPEYEDQAAGLYKIEVEDGHIKSVTMITKEDITNLGIPAQDTTYGVGGEQLGLVKNGGNITINPDGTMTAPEVNAVQSDWNSTESNEGAIKNKPPIENGTGEKSVVIGSGIARGICSVAEGSATNALGDASHAEGNCTIAEGYFSHAEGIGATGTGALGKASHVENNKCTASGTYAHAEGNQTEASGTNAHSQGSETIASGPRAHAEGNGTVASGFQAHAEGEHTRAYGNNQHVQGRFNIEDKENKYAHIVGNGLQEDAISWEEDTIIIRNRSNAHTLDWQGNASFAGSVKSNGEDYAEYFEWLDGNSDNEDRVGLLVTLDGEKIKLANAGDEILGVISGTVAVLGGNYEWEWNGKYLTDDFGRVIYDMVEEFTEEIVGEDEEGNSIIEKQSLGFFKHPRINPDYDPEQKYINRSDRPEWDTVGMLGKLHVRDDGTCEVNGYATVGENGVATASNEKTNMRVLSRVNENVIRILLMI